MIKGLQKLFQLSVDIHLAREKINVIEKELKALEIIKKYAVLNRAFKEQTKHKHNLVLIEIRALIPDEEYNLIKEVLQ